MEKASRDKSVAVAFVLTFLFGPLGLCYVSFIWAFGMVFATVALAILGAHWGIAGIAGLGWLISIGIGVWWASEEQSDYRSLQQAHPRRADPQVTTSADQLAKLADLLERGHLSQDEFDAEKSRLLADGH